MNWITTPSHGYLEVEITDFFKVIKENEITSADFKYSYRTQLHAYLEEDCEAGKYLELVKVEPGAIDECYSEEFDEAREGNCKFNGLDVTRI